MDSARASSPEAGSDYALVLDAEFDALCLEAKREDGGAGAMSSKKYPAKLHARRVAAELDADEGLIYLPGEPTRQYEDSDMGPPWRQRKYFYYISGVDFADCAVTYDIAADWLTLWVPYVEPRQVLWFGTSPDADEARKRYDVDEVRYTRGLRDFLDGRVRCPGTVFVLYRSGGLGDDLRSGSGPRARIDTTSLRPAMDAARVVKTAHEVSLIRRACAISAAAHRRVAAELLTFRNERDVETVYTAECLARGARAQAYPVIAGAGPAAATLHYGANDQPLKGKNLLVIDAGCEWSAYASDITRTLPIGGAFTGRAASVHEIVQQMQDASISRVHPGVVFRRLHLLAADVAMQGLLELGILQGDPDEIRYRGTVAAFFPHGLGHHVGLVVHDVSGRDPLMISDRPAPAGSRRRDAVGARLLGAMHRVAKDEEPYKRAARLQPNMVVTVEPGIYFCREYLEGYFLDDPNHTDFIDWDVLEQYYEVGGVRIEDVVLVTEDGHEVLSDGAPKGKELEDVINGRRA